MGKGSSGSGNAWRAQLRKMAKAGKMPSFITGPREGQAQVFEEIDRLYPAPDKSNVYRLTEREDSYYIQAKDGTTSISYFPRGENASEAEKRGVLKWALWKK